MVRGASAPFDTEKYLRGNLTPVYFGTALPNFGVHELLDDFVGFAPSPQPRQTQVGRSIPEITIFRVLCLRYKLTWIQSTEINAMRICSGVYTQG